MIIANGVPKSGTTLLVSCLMACGLDREPGVLVTDEATGEIVLHSAAPGEAVRSTADVLAEHDERVLQGHVYDDVDPGPHKVAFIVRHPRDVLVSWARWAAIDRDWTYVDEQPSVEVIRSRIKMQSGFVRARLLERSRRMVGWLQRADAVVRFEDLVATPHVAASRLVRALSVPEPSRPFLNGDASWLTHGFRGTWSGLHSDWRQTFDDELVDLWSAWGGVEIERCYGYAV